jgi:hypothetical protein
MDTVFTLQTDTVEPEKVPSGVSNNNLLLLQEQHLMINNSLENTIINNCCCQNNKEESQQQQLFLTEITNHFSNSLSMEIGMSKDLIILAFKFPVPCSFIHIFKFKSLVKL